MDNLTLMIRKDEMEILRQIDDVYLRSNCIFLIHQFATLNTPTLGLVIKIYGLKDELYEARNKLVELGLVTFSTYTAKVHARFYTLPFGDEDRGYDFKETDEEYERLKRLSKRRDLIMKRRIDKVQNINGIRFTNLEEFEKALLFHNEQLEFLKAGRIDGIIDEYLEKDIRTLEYNITAIKSVINGNIEVVNYKEFEERRLYSTFTTLPKELRQYVVSDYGEFWELDIKASQPRLIKTVLTSMLDGVTLCDYAIRVRKIPSFDKNADNSKLMTDFSAWKDEVCSELSRFDDLTQDDFYLAMSEGLIDRDEAKKEFMVYFFDYQKKMCRSYYFYQYMQNRFPRIEEYVKLLKLGHSFSEYNKHSYDISSNLAAYEAKIILETICFRFRKENPDSCIFTIHDSINVNYKDLERIIELAKQAYSEHSIKLAFELKNLKTGEKFKSFQESLENVKTLKNVENVKTPIEYRYNQLLCRVSGNNDTKIVDESNIRQVDNNGSSAWMYRGTGNQQMKKSCKKYTKEQFIELVNEKFRSREWK